ncbi:MAG: DUF2800 domain-containing protein [Limnohabitans sp.]
MTAAHSTWSASKFESIMLCPGKIVLEQGLPDNTNAYAAEGTAAHQVLTWALQEDRQASAYIGRVIEVEGFTFEVDQDMAEHVQVCIDYCNDLRGDDGVLFADIRVNYSQYLDVEFDQAWGTADVIIARGDEIIVVDFKYGRGHEVEAERNPQMSLYGLGALQAYQGLVADFNRVRMAISQPRIKRAPSEWDCSVEELEAWGRSTARNAVVSCNLAAYDTPADPEVWAETHLSPSEKACKFCKAKATCPALRAEVDATLTLDTPADVGEFETIVEPNSETPEQILARALSKVDLIEDWCKSIRAETERRLLAGQAVPGWKLVQGKRGNRAWDKPAEVEALLKSMRLKESEMYDFKLISPASAEKLAKAGTIGPRQWPKLQSLITQPDGKAHVAPESDSRPALVVTPVADDFNDVTADFN